MTRTGPEADAEVRGALRKMDARPAAPVLYELPVGDRKLPISSWLGGVVRLTFEGEISCIHCGRAMRKSFAQGYCYPCFRRLARCDACIVKPEQCHFAAGTCREPDWGEANCMLPHTVYLANSSSLKVGITRGLDPIRRWIDQGATQGLAILRVPTRRDSGLVEVALKRHVSDRTDWRRMLRGEAEPLDLPAERDRLLPLVPESEPDAWRLAERVEDARTAEVAYPVLEYPKKITSHNLDKNPVLEGTLLGIKGQYLILDTAVINVRKYAGYVVRVRGGG